MEIKWKPLFRGRFKVLGGYIGIMEKKMETMGIIHGRYWGYILG